MSDEKRYSKLETDNESKPSFGISINVSILSHLLIISLTSSGHGI